MENLAVLIVMSMTVMMIVITVDTLVGGGHFIWVPPDFARDAEKSIIQNLTIATPNFVGGPATTIS